MHGERLTGDGMNMGHATQTTLMDKQSARLSGFDSREVITYHRKETCNNCGSLNETKQTDGEGGTVYECETKCTCCGFRDYWAHGFFASMQDGYDACEKYQG